jgi:hypothetical protein
MLLNKKEYTIRRQKKLRGQGDSVAVKFYPKGETVEYVKDGKKKEFPNAIGSRVLALGKISRRVNRAEIRKKYADRQGSAKNYKHQQGKWDNPFSHAINEHKHELSFPPGLTNHTRHKERQLQRLAFKQVKATNEQS